mmetsp:Transcript_48821/g.161734  ORF Transcript_48821/g.161734 Transcript_48821/m.161734 type:complete len:236 (+) Transcript_48821:454-1161(+)
MRAPAEHDMGAPLCSLPLPARAETDASTTKCGAMAGDIRASRSVTAPTADTTLNCSTAMPAPSVASAERLSAAELPKRRCSKPTGVGVGGSARPRGKRVPERCEPARRSVGGPASAPPPPREWFGDDIARKLVAGGGSGVRRPAPLRLAAAAPRAASECGAEVTGRMTSLPSSRRASAALSAPPSASSPKNSVASIIGTFARCGAAAGGTLLASAPPFAARAAPLRRGAARGDGG